MMSSLRIGYAFHGFLGDRKLDHLGNELSTPDGNATYSWSIVWAAMQRGHHVIPLQKERDADGIYEYGADLFDAFSKQKRTESYLHLFYGPGGLGGNDDGWRKGSGELGSFPELDVLLVEWRFPIIGRNTPEMKGKPGYQTDLERQTQILEHYKGSKTKVIIWDLDQKLMSIDENHWSDAVFETSVEPKKQSCYPRIRVEPPFIIDDLLQLRTDIDTSEIAYVGSRYERDDVIDEWIAPFARKNPGAVSFHGKWEPRDELKFRWPGITFHDRIGVAGFHAAYSCATCVPLLAKRSYMETGFVTPRVWEAILFGSLPVGLSSHLGIREYTKVVAETPSNLEYVVRRLGELSLKERHQARVDAAHRLRFMDAGRFVDEIERVVG